MSHFIFISCDCLRLSVVKLFNVCGVLFLVLSPPVHVKTFGIVDLDEQRKQINGICVLFIIVAVTSFISQFLQVSFPNITHL